MKIKEEYLPQKRRLTKHGKTKKRANRTLDKRNHTEMTRSHIRAHIQIQA